ncbi:MAG TPA: type II 3-dehydroquinate dehydratase [Acidimicrobiales bacterium]|nr:type II 3-dehydroquinate dehydratase [Acidimicrobiales bacterium]
MPNVDGSKLIALLHGPNLNLLGQREVDIYGTTTEADLVASVEKVAAVHGLSVEFTQSNHEGELVSVVHAARGRVAGLIVNGGALSHYGWSLHDALAAFDGPVIEVHLSNTARRERWRHDSVLTPVSNGAITGLGLHGYELATIALVNILENQ